jgi:hypothetical protein
MKSIKKVPLYEFHEDPIPENVLDIDWPKVHKTVGVDKIDWVHNQRLKDCQLVLEFDRYGTKRLVVEFYNTAIVKKYFLMWS